MAFERVRGAAHNGVGDDEHSWAVDGARQRKWHQEEEEEDEEEETGYEEEEKVREGTPAGIGKGHEEE